MILKLFIVFILGIQHYQHDSTTVHTRAYNTFLDEYCMKCVNKVYNCCWGANYLWWLVNLVLVPVLNFHFVVVFTYVWVSWAGNWWHLLRYWSTGNVQHTDMVSSTVSRWLVHILYWSEVHFLMMCLLMHLMASLLLECNNCIFVQIKLNGKYINIRNKW